MKYLEVQARIWFDNVNGNSYFSARIFGGDELIAVLPFQYGYGDFYLQAAAQWLIEADVLPNGAQLTRYCRENEIRLLVNKVEGCLKCDVISYGTERG